MTAIGLNICITALSGFLGAFAFDRMAPEFTLRFNAVIPRPERHILRIAGTCEKVYKRLSGNLKREIH